MLTADLEYDLPAELIAQDPPPERGGSLMMVVHSGAAAPGPVLPFSAGFLEQLRPDDLIVVNSTKVLHARLQLQRASGGAVELLLLTPLTRDADEQCWTAFARPVRRLQPGEVLSAPDGCEVQFLDRNDDTVTVRIPVGLSAAEGWLLQHGTVPLPPYVTDSTAPADRYQTLYAREPGSVAAPTAGLHFDERLWDELQERHEVATLTLHVGAGTFQPVRAERLNEHVMHQEYYDVPASSHAQIQQALQAGRRIVAIGTTSLRVLETVYGVSPRPRQGVTDLFITPGYSFAATGALLTNFHLPRSSLLALVMAFATEQTTRAAYQAAIEHRMRFYSYGDCMFIDRPSQ